MYDYSRLNRTLKEKSISKNNLIESLGFSSRTVAKIKNGEKLSHNTIEKIALFLGCEPSTLYREISDNRLLQRLRDEKEAKISGSIYHELQVRMTYNSNHIEGSRLTEDQTRLIFETNTINTEDGVLVDDILETVHHFRAIDYCIDHAEDKLSENIIKELHYILKHDTKDSLLDWFNVGEYKKRPNMVGGRETANPIDVKSKIQELLKKYNELEQAKLEDIVMFHAEFEKIHPFQDGNGRVGRLIAFKECLKNNIVPFIIEDTKKGFYYRGLSKWDDEQGWLIDTCLDGQDTVMKLIKRLEIEL